MMIREGAQAQDLLSDDEAERLRLSLSEVLPRLERHHLLDIADMLHAAARDRRRPEPRSFSGED